MAEAQNDPLLPGYCFMPDLVAGLTPIEANGYLDFFHPPTAGNERLYSQSHHSRSGGGGIRDENLSADRVIFCCSRQERFITTAVIRRLANGITSGFTFVRAPTGMNGLTGRQYLPIRVSFARMKRTSRISATCLGKSLTPGKGEGRYSELLAINLLEQLLLRRMEAINEVAPSTDG